MLQQQQQQQQQLSPEAGQQAVVVTRMKTSAAGLLRPTTAAAAPPPGSTTTATIPTGSVVQLRAGTNLSGTKVNVVGTVGGAGGGTAGTAKVLKLTPQQLQGIGYINAYIRRRISSSSLGEAARQRVDTYQPVQLNQQQIKQKYGTPKI